MAAGWQGVGGKAPLVHIVHASCIWALLLLHSAYLCSGSASKVGVGVSVGIGRRRRTRDAEVEALAKLEKQLQDGGTTPSPELLELQELESALNGNEEKPAAPGDASKKLDFGHDNGLGQADLTLQNLEKMEKDLKSSVSSSSDATTLEQLDKRSKGEDDAEAALQEELAKSEAMLSSSSDATAVQQFDKRSRGQEDADAALQQELAKSEAMLEEELPVKEAAEATSASVDARQAVTAEVDAAGASSLAAPQSNAHAQVGQGLIRRQKSRDGQRQQASQVSASALEVQDKSASVEVSRFGLAQQIEGEAAAHETVGESMEAAFERRKRQQVERLQKFAQAKAFADKENEESMEAAFKRRKAADQSNWKRHPANVAGKVARAQKLPVKLESNPAAPRLLADGLSASGALLDRSDRYASMSNATAVLGSANLLESSQKSLLNEQAALVAEAEELSNGLQIATHRQLQMLQKADPEAAEMQMYMMIKSESVRAACFLKCLEHNPLSGKLYIATCHRGPNQKWKLKAETLVYQYDTQGSRICKDYQDWRKSSAGVAYELSLPGKPFGFIAASWEDCRATCFSLLTCKQVVYRKATRSCELMKAKMDSDQDGAGGQNVEYVSAHCEEGTGLPKCLENNNFLNIVTMAECNGKANQKWYFQNHQMISRADNKCLSLKNPSAFGRPSNAAANEVSVTEHCDTTDSNQRWHWA